MVVLVGAAGCQLVFPVEGSSCPEAYDRIGTATGARYRVSTEPAIWDEAVVACAAEGTPDAPTRLVVVSGTDELAEVSSFASGFIAWIGLHQVGTRWIWIGAGAPEDFPPQGPGAPWGDGKPDANGNCVRLEGGELYNQGCANRYVPICECE